jgi:hypothetical protein
MESVTNQVFMLNTFLPVILSKGKAVPVLYQIFSIPPPPRNPILFEICTSALSNKPWSGCCDIHGAYNAYKGDGKPIKN